MCGSDGSRGKGQRSSSSSGKSSHLVYPVKNTIAHKASKADWRRKARWRKMSATKRL